MKLESLLNTFENISDIALAFYDEESEVLRELSDQGDYFCVAPFSVQYKRLYIIGDLLYNNSINISAKLNTDFENQYEIKLKLGSEYNQVSDFDGCNDTVSGEYKNTSHKYLNALPLDVLIVSKNLTEKSTSILFELSIQESDISCAGNTSKVYVDTINWEEGPILVEMDGVTIGHMVEGSLPPSLDSIFNYNLSNVGDNFIENVSDTDHSLYFETSMQLMEIGDFNYSFMSYETTTSVCLKKKSYSYTVLCTDPSYSIEFDLDSAQAARYNYDVYVDDGYLCSLNWALSTSREVLANFSFTTYSGGGGIFAAQASNRDYKVEFRIRDINGPKLVPETETQYTETDTSFFTCLGGAT